MASVYKRGKKWVASYRGPNGAWQAKTVGTDKTGALQLANKLETDAMLRRTGIIDTKADALAIARGRPVAEHVEAYKHDLAARGGTDKHVRLTVQRINGVLERANASRIETIRPQTINEAVGRLRSEGYSERAFYSGATQP